MPRKFLYQLAPCSAGGKERRRTVVRLRCGPTRRRGGRVLAAMRLPDAARHHDAPFGHDDPTAPPDLGFKAQTPRVDVRIAGEAWVVEVFGHGEALMPQL